MTIFNGLRFWQILAVLTAMCSPQIATAQNAANQGNLNVNGRRIVLKNVAAVRGKYYGEGRIMVVATGQPLTADVIKKVKETGPEENLDVEVKQPYLKAVFTDDGSLRCLIGMGGGTSFGERGPPLEGQATIADGRIRGSVKAVRTGTFAKEVSLAFDVPIDAEVKVAGPAKLDPPVKPTLTGKFVGNGKASAMKYVVIEEHERFNDQDAVTLIFTEQDPATAKKPSFDAMFGKLGSALILSVHRDGGIFGCQVVHSAHSKQGFTSLGKIHMVEFEIAGGNATGHVSTGGVLDTFGEKWEVELKFAAPLPDKLRNAPAAMPTPTATEPPEVTKKAPAGPRIAARKLPLPKDASDVQYKQLVEHIQFSSTQPVEAVANEFSAKLKQQGWKDSAGSLMGKKNAILKREQGDAKLTIMVQPVATGSIVKIFTEGLDWSGGDESKPPAPAKTADDDDDADDIEKQAEKLLEDALKKLPKGL